VGSTVLFLRCRRPAWRARVQVARTALSGSVHAELLHLLGDRLGVRVRVRQVADDRTDLAVHEIPRRADDGLFLAAQCHVLFLVP
jgi:hypothetical protein